MQAQLMPVLIFSLLLASAALIFFKENLEQKLWEVYHSQLPLLDLYGFGTDPTVILEYICQNGGSYVLYGKFEYNETHVCIEDECLSREGIECEIIGENNTGLIKIEEKGGDIYVG